MKLIKYYYMHQLINAKLRKMAENGSSFAHKDI